MTSSMLSGEKRWTSSRRGGMTVLGKVAVPKPINLPSQRLENHGLDPNVEIVPKGTLSWGSKSSSASNAWGPSSLSPNTDGGACSPSHLSTRPSSGGSGTRPSTAGSDKTVELTASAWGSNSRPSSASGALTSNQTSLSSVRPHSAETRPGSSQLSRFAEHSSEISGAWSAARTTEKLGVAHAKNSEFSLSSGDFPTLGSEKDKSVKNSDLQDHNSHSRPGSSSGLGKVKTESSVVDDVPMNANAKDGAVNSWRRDYPAFSEDGVRPSIEKHQGNPQLYPNPGIPPQHYDTWHGPTMNNPQGGFWFRGPPGGPPFGNPVAPGGFSVEPFPYYRPHIPPAGLANPPPVPPPGAGPRGPHPKNGDVYMPHMPDAYIRPSMPIRPGFYPGPIPYEGYYSLPMGYHNSNERDVPFMGMASGPHVYNRYSNQNPTETSNSQGRSGGYGSDGKASASEQVESSRPSDAGGPYRVLLKQHEWDEKKEQSQLEDPMGTNESNTDRRDQPRIPVLENEQRSDYRKNEEMDLRTGTRGEEASPQTVENQGSDLSVIKSRPLHGAGNISASEGAASGVLELPLRPAAPKDSSLIQKIEGLNAKVRDNSSGKSREEQRLKFHVGSAPVNHQSKEIGAGAGRSHTAEVINAPPREVGAAGGEKNLESSSFSGTATARRTTQAMQGRADYRNKGKMTQDADGWQKKSEIADSPTLSAAQLELSSVHIGDHRISVESYDRSRSYHQTRLDGHSMQTMSDPSDSEAQRAKLIELAKQRTKQLHEEEEERTRNLKAKALAKLDELNRRTQVVEGSTQKESAAGYAIQNKHEELRPSDLASVSGKSGAPDSAIMCNANVDCQISDTSSYKVEKSTILSREPPLQTLENVVKEPVLCHDPSTIIHQDVKSADVTCSAHVHNSIASKHKRMSYKQKQTQSSDQSSNQKIVSALPTALKDENDTVVDERVPSGVVTNEIGQTVNSGLPINSNALVESSANQKRKNFRNGKNKQKVEGTLPLETLPSPMPKEAFFSRSSVETDQPRALEFEIDQDAVQPASFSKDHNQNSEQHRHPSNEESHGRTNSQWKSQHSRRVPRNTQSNRLAEKFHGNDAVMWAPVKPQNKTEITDELSDKNKIDTVNPVKGDQQLHNFSKNKRAEMERYIPKPFAKEMAQHGNIQQVPSINQINSVETVGKTDSGSQGPQATEAANPAVGKVGSGMESKNVDGRLSKQGKAHGSWRQRGSTESTNMHDMQDGVNATSKSDHSVQKSSGHQHGQKSEMSTVKGETKHHTNISGPDGTNNSNSHESVALVSNPVLKDQIPTGRGKRVPFRGHKSIGVNHDTDLKKNGEETEKIESQMSTSEPSQADTGAAFKENRGIGERMISHWQPKSQPSNYQRGNRPNKQSVGSEVGQVNRKDSATHVDSSLSAGHDKEPNDHSAPTRDEQSIVSEKNKAEEPPNVGNQEFKRERRSAPQKGHPHSPNQVPVNHVEQAPTNMDVRHEQHPSSGFRKNGNQNRFGRGHESRGDWTPQGQGNRHYSLSANREKQGQNLHYEYHPVGPYDNSKSDNPERSKDGNQSGVKFRERGQMHPRRGGANFHGRQVGGYD